MPFVWLWQAFKSMQPSMLYCEMCELPCRLMTVTVKSPDGRLESIAIDRHAAATQLYLEVERRTGIPHSDYKILYQGIWPVKVHFTLWRQQSGAIQICCRSTHYFRSQTKQFWKIHFLSFVSVWSWESKKSQTETVK